MNIQMPLLSNSFSNRFSGYENSFANPVSNRMVSESRFQPRFAEAHVHGPDCDHDHDQAQELPKGLFAKISFFFTAIPKWFREFFQGLVKDLKQIFRGPSESSDDHAGHDHSAHDGHDHSGHDHASHEGHHH